MNNQTPSTEIVEKYSTDLNRASGHTATIVTLTQRDNFKGDA